MSASLRLHVGCGTIYLDNWTNVDVPSDTTFLASERPDLFFRYRTSENDYYGRHKENILDRVRAGPKVKESVCDAYGTFQRLPFEQGSVGEILSRQVWEHFDIAHAIEALAECRRVLKPDGILRIDVPDILETLRLYAETKDPLYVRHFIGPVSKGTWGRHCVTYQREELKTLVEAHGFAFVEEEPNIHFYPAFCLKFRRA